MSTSSTPTPLNTINDANRGQKKNQAATTVAQFEHDNATAARASAKKANEKLDDKIFSADSDDDLQEEE